MYLKTLDVTRRHALTTCSQERNSDEHNTIVDAVHFLAAETFDDDDLGLDFL